MQAIEVDFAQIPELIGKTFGPSAWVRVDQECIDTFADVTGDQAWYHVDVPRATTELPDGRPIAHGYLTLSLVPALSNEILRIRYKSRALNYGADRVRFPAPVLAGDRIRLRTTPSALTSHRMGTLLRLDHVVEIEGRSKAALSFVRLTLVLDEYVGRLV